MVTKKNKVIDLSIVIATHNRPNELKSLIDSIFESELPNYEILLIGTSKNDFQFVDDKNNIIKIVSDKKNQVYQRNVGFQKSNGKYILQVDDDIIFGNNAIKLLYDKILKSRKTILSINLLNSNGEKAYKRWVEIYNSNKFFRNLIFFLNGFKKVRPYSVISSGRPVPYFSNENINNYEKSEWLNSCFMFSDTALNDYKKNISSGKAFYEDIFTTHNFFHMGYKLKTLEEAQGFHPITDPMDFFTHLRTIKNQFVIVRKFKKSFVLFFFDLIIFSLIFFIYNFKNKR